MTPRFSRLARPCGGLLAAALAFAAFQAPASAAAASMPPPSDTTFGEARILWLLNEERRMRGLAPVQRHPGADEMAQWSANVQAWYGRLGHNPNLGRDTTNEVGPWWFVGENVGCAADADHLHSMWMQSSSHAANVVQGAIETVGIGTVYARGCLWATVVVVDRQ